MASFETIKERAEETWRRSTAGPNPRITVGMGRCGIDSGSRQTLAALEAELEGRGLEAVVEITGCIGVCYAQPLVTISRPGEPAVVYQEVRADRVSSLIEEVLVQGRPQHESALGVHAEQAYHGIPSLMSLDFFQGQTRRLMANYGIIDPENIDHYIAHGGYEALHKALSSMTPEQVIEEMVSSGSGGRGGAYFSTGRKWDFLRRANRHPKYILCNADEGDPGAFVNRTTLESDPHSVIEGMIIAAYATEADQGYIYLRSEYPHVAQRLEVALAQARERGLLGEGILDSDFSFDIGVVRGAGSYVCGEETALISSIQDSRGMPRIRPPFPAQAGLWDQPTNVNNVESYAHVPLIIRNGAQWYAELGTEGLKGTKLFSISGDIRRTGVVEVPFGTPLRQVIEGMGGGIPQGRALKAIQPGGPLGGIMPGSAIDLGLDREPFSTQGVLLGSGGLVVIDERACIVSLTRQFMLFGQDESCARCSCCRIGSMRLVDIFDRIVEGEGRAEDLDWIRRLDVAMRNNNCAHGQGVPIAATSLLRHFEEELSAHILERRCDAKVCPGLIRYHLDGAPCESCADCAPVCPTEAILKGDQGWYLDDAKCVRCGACLEVCTRGAITVHSPAESVPQPSLEPLPE